MVIAVPRGGSPSGRQTNSKGGMALESDMY